MRNPNNIIPPRLNSPIGNGQKTKNKNKGNMPYLRQRRKLRKVVF